MGWFFILLAAVNLLVFQPIKQQFESLNQPVEKPLSQQWYEQQHIWENLLTEEDRWSGVISPEEDRWSGVISPEEDRWSGVKRVVKRMVAIWREYAAFASSVQHQGDDDVVVVDLDPDPESEHQDED